MLKTLSHWSITFKYTSLFHRQVLKPHTFWDQIGLNRSTRWSLIPILGPRGSHGASGSIWWAFWWSIRHIWLYKVIQIFLSGRRVRGSTWDPRVHKKTFWQHYTWYIYNYCDRNFHKIPWHVIRQNFVFQRSMKYRKKSRMIVSYKKEIFETSFGGRNFIVLEVLKGVKKFTKPYW